MLDEKVLGWDVCEARSLIDYILNNKNHPFSQNFFLWSQKNGRGAFSVRNYFYKLISLLKSDEKFKDKLNLSQEDFEVLTCSPHFNVEEEIILIKNILCLSYEMSVRSACLKFSNGSKNLMLRNQNKFRKLLKTKKELVEKIMEDLKTQNINFKNPYEEKVVVISKTKSISKEDVNSLFLGLLKLVRDELKEEVRQDVNLEKKELINKIRLQQVKERSLQEENKKLKSVICDAQKEIEKINLCDDKKIEKLKNFIKSIKEQKIEFDEQKW